MKKESQTKLKVMEAAADLFNQNGFNGVSVREIAKQANVNVSLISYYFGGKKGLLETLMIYFFEEYINRIEKIYQEYKNESAKDALIKIVNSLLNYFSEKRSVTRFALREVTMDTVLIREIMVTYFAKEKYMLQSIIEKGIKAGEFRRVPIFITLTQFKALLTMPYLQPHYLSEVFYTKVNDSYFINQYSNEIKNWIEKDLCHEGTRSKSIKSILPISV